MRCIRVGRPANLDGSTRRPDHTSHKCHLALRTHPSTLALHALVQLLLEIGKLANTSGRNKK